MTPGICDRAAALSNSTEASAGPPVSAESEPAESLEHCEPRQQTSEQGQKAATAVTTRDQVEHSPPPQYPASEASSSRPPPFSSLFAPFHDTVGESSGKPPSAVPVEACASASQAAPAYRCDSIPEPSSTQPDRTSPRAFYDPVGETKRALPRDTKVESSRKDEDAEPPPAYSEGDSPLAAFTYVMSAAGGAASIITQVQQGGPPINALGGETF